MSIRAGNCKVYGMPLPALSYNEYRAKNIQLPIMNLNLSFSFPRSSFDPANLNDKKIGLFVLL